ncbi:MAG: Glutamyl-tRNA(Gln) amidotransferase subunit A [Verrucomicrobia subdivision 3 bacterium]|nr:Glutamyl-tRNA(Gln) amidotransferase subunit A [Limisphaerales bacterium]MCS1413856.1 Glutamyl-tRNA(Gln) amidotransferase subunit A [Limisphaerales bacterium]
MLNKLNIAEARRKLLAKEISATELTQACLDRLAAIDQHYHAFLSSNADKALAQAAQADALLESTKLTNGKPLLGIPIALKDNLAVEGEPLTCASKILENFISPYDSTVATKLKDAGAIFIGRLNLDEFAMGSSTENSAFGPTKNPWALDRTPGGSSGGSAAAVASDQCIAALGSDTGGSIRQPAAFCGCVGLKPSYGRVSRYGLVAFASSLDQIGPVAKTAEDAATLLNVIAGHDPRDSTSVPESVPDFTAALSAPINDLKIGLPKEYFIHGLNPDVRTSVESAIKTYTNLGAKMIEISLPHTEYVIATYYLIATAEASANLARFEGIRYGHRVEGEDLFTLNSKTRGKGFGPEVKRRVILGTYSLSSGYYDAYYLKAQKARTLIRQDFRKAFEKVDLILTPTTPIPAFRLGDKVSDPLQIYLLDIFTISANLVGNCGISLPCGFTKDPKLPIGLQLLSKPFGETALLHAAHAFEQATEWGHHKPEIRP